MVFVLRRILLFFGMFLFWLNCQSQTFCGLKNDNDEQRQLLLQTFLNVSSNQKARKGTTYMVYIKPKIIHNTTDNQLFKESQVFELVNKLNAVFAAINIQFQIDSNKIEHIYDNEYYDLKVNSEGALRAKWDKEDGINLYFAHSITRSDLSLLNGYTSLPNLSNGSNAIIISYQENDSETFSLIKNKIISHEFGHYFGLYHTYQDSNEADVSKRELVTRGVGANCNVAGDQLCDTQADPFERVPSIFSLACNEAIPQNIFDTNGDSYNPPVDNFMSYHNSCGFHFTAMQYQKMEAGLNIRLSPQAEYSITRNVTNFLSINSLNKNSFCVGEEVIVNYQKNGVFDTKSNLSLEISDKNGLNFKEMIDFELLADNKIKFKISPLFENGSNYRILIKTSIPYTESPISSHFEIRSMPTANISVSSSKISEGEEVQILVSFGGSGPWSFKDWEGINYENLTSPSLVFNASPIASSLFSVSEIKNECGILTQIPSVFVEVVPATIQIEPQSVFCSSSLIELKTLGISSSEAPNYYQVQIADGSNKTIVFPEISNNGLKFYFPSQLQIGKNYTLKIIGKKLGEVSKSMPFIVKTPPSQPKISTPLNVCFGSQNEFLKADGKNLKWYTAVNDTSFTYSVLLNTSIPGKFDYYVSQSDSNKCESSKSKMEVIISEPVSAQISGNSSILLGDSTFIKVSLKGLPPWQFSFEDLGIFNVSIPEFYINVKPNINTMYKLSAVSNYCGEGATGGLATVEVISILSSIPIEFPNLKIFPNPIYHQPLLFEISNDRISEIQFFTLDGKLAKKAEIPLSNKFEINLEQFLGGKYILKLRGEKNNYQSTIQVLK